MARIFRLRTATSTMPSNVSANVSRTTSRARAKTNLVSAKYVTARDAPTSEHEAGIYPKDWSGLARRARLSQYTRDAVFRPSYLLAQIDPKTFRWSLHSLQRERYELRAHQSERKPSPAQPRKCNDLLKTWRPETVLLQTRYDITSV